MANETEKSAKRAPPSPDEGGPMRGGRPVEPTPQDKDRHPSSEAENRSDKVRKGGHSSEGGNR